VAQSALLADIVRDLGDRYAGVYSGITAHSPRPCVIEGARLAREAGADLLVAVGGGSAIELGTSPAIGEPPCSPLGIAACATGAAEEPSSGEPLPANRRPIAKKQPNTTSRVTISTGHSPRMLAPGPPMRTPSQS